MVCATNKHANKKGQTRLDDPVMQVILDTDLSPDPADNFHLAIVEVGDADFHVAGDRRGILRFRKHRSTQIVSVRQMVDVRKV